MGCLQPWQLALATMVSSVGVARSTRVDSMRIDFSTCDIIRPN